MCRKQCGSTIITEHRELLSVNATHSHPNKAIEVEKKKFCSKIKCDANGEPDRRLKRIYGDAIVNMRNNTVENQT